jgi:hypothetical protein
MQERTIATFYFTYTKFTRSFWEKSKYKKNISYVRKKMTNYVKIQDWSKNVKWSIKSIKKWTTLDIVPFPLHDDEMNKHRPSP